MRRARRCSLLSALAAATLTLVGCTEIPSDSAPEVIRAVDRGNAGAAQPNITPEAGSDGREIVSDFLLAGVAADAGHSSSRQFLTNAAARKWQDSAVIVVDETAVGIPVVHGGSETVAVTGRRVGQLDAGGVFSPSLKGIGVGDPETFSFGLVKVAGQWRIDQLQPGVLISQSAFSNSYHARKLFFFDSSETTLVPDLRYTALSGQSLATWLLQELLAGPRPELAQSVLNEVPEQVGKSSVQTGDPIQVEMPGTAQLDASGRNALAAELAYTLGQIQFAQAQLQLTDAGRLVRVPAGSGATFSTLDFNSVGPDSALAGVQPYFVRDAAVVSGVDAAALPGPLGVPGADIESVALRHAVAGGIQVAAIVGGSLEVGSSSRLAKVALPAGQLSRPEWRPHAADVWVGDGSGGAIYRVTPNQAPRQVSITSPVGGLPPGQVLALRFSLDGVRLAAVLRAPNDTETAWVGSVVTSGSDVRIDSFEPLTPSLLRVDDIAWADATKLLMVAAAPNDETRVWQMLSDGSRLDSLTNVGLPGPPTAIAASAGRLPLVSASNSIWTQRGSSWIPFPGSIPTPGVNPVYAP